MRRRMAAIEQRAAKVPADQRPRVFIEIASDPLYTAGKGSFLDELVTKAGGINIASTLNQPFAQINGEFVIQQNPDVILICYMGVVEDPAGEIAKRMGWSRMKAVREGRIIADIHPDLLCRPGPRLMDGLEKLHSRLYPDAAPQGKSGKVGEARE
jgi:iron complex transport system substrate-binding protein